eukprot:TRINITY_DN20633_c0_g1_i1.p1 TRINITY_DN20633_c0_g1~~TRINITY_DN20633_c0_g1_i1.p1  ORF type:complete len:209 (+),score=31.82 TRINITY_DN20633_c0_g1_i1:28-654(+)
MSIQNFGVGAEGLLAAQSVLAGEPDSYGNDSRVEQLWAMKAMDHAEVYFNLLCSVEPSRLKLTGNLEDDDVLYNEFRSTFPNLDIGKLKESDLKSEANKEIWRTFSENHKHIEDYSLGSLLRLDSSLDYSEENTIIAVKVQFLAIEIARNREGFNNEIRGKYKATPRKPKGKSSSGGACNTASAQPPVMTEIEHELQQILGGHHALLK